MDAILSSLRRVPGAGRVLRALGIGGVPATGYFGAGWSLGTLLLLYWLETILVTLVVAILILRHRHATRRAGHWGSEYSVTTTRGGRTTTRSGTTTFLKSFLGVMVPFTAGHGIFVFVFVFLVFPQEVGPAARLSPDALADGMTAIALFLLASLLLDLPGIGERPFGWVERLAQRAQGRMLVTHLTIIFGATAMAALDAPVAFLVVFVALKSLLDLGDLLPDRDARHIEKMEIGSYLVLPLTGAILALAALGCAAGSEEPDPEPWEVSRPAGMERASFELRPVLDEAAAGALELPDPEGEPHYLAESAAVSEADIARVEVSPASPPHSMVLLHFQPAAAQRLYAFTAEHVGSRVAIVIDGKVLVALEVQGRIGATMAINPGYTEDEIIELARRLAP